MDQIQHAPPGPATPFPAEVSFVECRTMRRSACAFDIIVRERGRSAVACLTTDLTPYGARLSGVRRFEPDSEMWLRLPGLESQTVRVIWSQGGTIGVAFVQPLHSAVFARFLPADTRLTLVDAPAMPLTMPSEIAALSRREQILRGFGGAQEGPQCSIKKPLGGGMSAMIRRSVTRRANHRGEQRFADEVRTGPMRLMVDNYPAKVRNVSASGLRIVADLDADVGTRVAVEFDGFDAMAGRIVWRRAEEIGVSLPPNSLALNDA